LFYNLKIIVLVVQPVQLPEQPAILVLYLSDP
jgi:hypothetical protein